MSFKTKYFFNTMREFFKQGWFVYLVFLAIAYGFYFYRVSIGRYTFNVVTICVIPVVLAVFFIIFFAICSKVITDKYAAYQEIGEEKGYCREMLEAYERDVIIGRNPSNYEKLVHAEIIKNMGDPNTAIMFLSQMQIPTTETINYASYLTVYILSCIAAKNIGLAVSIRDANVYFINDFLKKGKLPFRTMLAFSLTCLEAAAGHYEEANNLIGKYYNPSIDKRGETTDFANLRVYIYHQTGNSSYEEIAVKQAKAAIEKAKLKTKLSKRSAYENLENAQKGILSIT